MPRVGPGGCKIGVLPSWDGLPSPHFQGGTDLVQRMDTAQIFSQGQKGAALFASICSNQAGLQGEKMGLQSSSTPPLTPYLSHLSQAKGTEGSNRRARVGIQNWHMNTGTEGIY